MKLESLITIFFALAKGVTKSLANIGILTYDTSTLDP